MVVNPIPLYPPSPYQEEGGNGYIREAPPLFDSPCSELRM